MKQIRGVYHYEVPGLGLWVDSTALGESWRGSFNGYEIELTLPKTAGAFGIDEMRLESSALTGSSSRRGAISAIGVRIVRVTVHATRDFDASSFQGGSGPRHAAYETDRVLQDVASTFAHNFFQQIRVNPGQHWIGSSSDIPRITLCSELLDHLGKRIPFGVHTVGDLVIFGVKQRLLQSRFAAAATDASKNAALDLSEELLSNARYIGGIRKPADLRYATLLAAIACESKVKSVLFAKANESQRALLELILDNPRDVSIAVAAHLDKTAQGVCGRSLRTDNPALWKEVSNLFRDRNRIAHGKTPQPMKSELKGHVKTATQVFEWLATL